MGEIGSEMESELYFRKLVILETLGVKLQNNNWFIFFLVNALFLWKKLYKVENSFKEKASNMYFSLRQLLHFLASLES